VQRKNRHVVEKSRSPQPSAAGSALERVRNGFRLRQRRPTVCVLSNHPVVLDHLDRAVKKKEFRVVSERLKQFSTGGAFLELPQAPLCVLDALGPKPATAGILQQILQAYPEASILLVSEKDAEEDCFDLLLLGARGLLSYEEASEHLTEALKCIAKGGFWLSPLRLSRFVNAFLGRYFSSKQSAVSTLSRRENEILERLFQDFSNKEIANELNISERTVKFHVSNLLQKFRVHGRRELILSYRPLTPTSLSGGYRGESFAGHSQGKSRFLPPAKDEVEEEILSGPVSPKPAYSVS
jgi:two-component system nitrate/nitrite response regulator NarL